MSATAHLNQSRIARLEECHFEMDTSQSSAGSDLQPAVAVYVRRAYKKYGNSDILRNLNMTVKSGTIYGLLGSSGAGKTTLLTCIVGQKTLDAGEIRVLGAVPGHAGSQIPGRRIGYMPQDIALYPNFNAKDTAVYFGWIFGMSSTEIEERLEFLMKLLDLPSRSILVKEMSGGQQRRLSLAVALIHDPEVLILDEPTVGVDPLLRVAIWDHLLHISAVGGKTIIVTTHYIEETRQADTIGLMRNGYLLEEASPETLMERFSCDTLEEVFLHLSQAQDERKRRSMMDVEAYDSRSQANPYPDNLSEVLKSCSSPQDSTKPRKQLWVGCMRALLYKNTWNILRNPSLVVFVFGQAVMLTAIFQLAFGNDLGSIPLAVVNDDGASSGLGCDGASMHANCSTSDLGCQFLLHLDEVVFRKVFRGDLDTAKEDVRRGRAWGVLHINGNFTDATMERIQEGRNARDKVLEDSSVHIWLDMSNKIISLRIYDELKTNYLQFAHNLLAACDYIPKLADIPVKILQPVYGSERDSLMNTVAPGLLLYINFFFGVALTVLSIVDERREGLLDRSLVAGVTMPQVMLAHLLSQLVLMIGQSITFVIFCFYVFSVTNVGPMAYVFMIIVIQGACGMCFGLVISAVCKSEGNAFYLSAISPQPMLFMSGIIWPLEGISEAVRWASDLLPLTYPIKALRAVMHRGWDPSYPEVMLGLGMSGVWIVVYLAIALTASKVRL